ncbi:MAG: hypothetical protein JW940_36150 [Polyangiaceae bacterium]|nr:hypothetical protein [Polyangiaceae bacterium]
MNSGALKRLTEAVLADTAQTSSEDEHSSVRGRAIGVDADGRIATGSASDARELIPVVDEHEATVERTVRLALIEHQHLDRDDPRAPLLRLAIVRRDEGLLLQLLSSLRT